uniref:Retinol dehydrogenase 11 n=1 Tax=Acrobeloides nanus TaxID=290746 RepID=A0A914D1E9_9BILA
MVNKKPKYSYHTTALEVLNNVSLSGKTILITGTTTGIGRETARALALKGAHVVMANRNVALSEELRNEIFKEINRNATIEEKLNKLIPSPSNNIGMVDAWKLYNISKLCNVLFAFKLHRLEHENGINMFVLHPGVITDTALTRNSQTFSKIFKFVSKPFVKTLEQGAATTVYCAASPHTQNESGRYYTNCADYEKDLDKALARDEYLQDLLWSKSLEFINQFERSIQI